MVMSEPTEISSLLVENARADLVFRRDDSLDARRVRATAHELDAKAVRRFAQVARLTVRRDDEVPPNLVLRETRVRLEHGRDLRAGHHALLSRLRRSIMVDDFK